MKISSGIFLLALLLVSSCEKDFLINQQSVSNRMAVNSLFNDGQPVTVFVTKPYAVGAPQGTITAISNARVELYEDSVFKEVMHYVPSDSQNAFGAYVSALLPQQGKTYSIKATDTIYNQATASDQIPVGATVLASSLQQYTDTGYNAQGIATIVFNDDPAVQNYYRVNVWISGQYRSIDGMGDTSYSFQSYAALTYPLSPVNDTVRDGDFFLFSDRGFNGQQKTLQVTFNTVDPANFVNLNLYVELHTVSKSHYQYFQTLNLYRTSNGSSEPVFIYTNVNGGFGDFVAEHIQSERFVIK